MGVQRGGGEGEEEEDREEGSLWVLFTACSALAREAAGKASLCPRGLGTPLSFSREQGKLLHGFFSISGKPGGATQLRASTTISRGPDPLPPQSWVRAELWGAKAESPVIVVLGHTLATGKPEGDAAL